MVAGGALAGITVVLPPAATGSDATVIALGAVALAVGIALLLTRRDLGEPLLGAVAVLGTVLITVATYEGAASTARGRPTTRCSTSGSACSRSTSSLLRNALVQIAVVGIAYAWLLSGQDIAAGDAATRWVVTMTALALRRHPGRAAAPLQRRPGRRAHQQGADRPADRGAQPNALEERVQLGAYACPPHVRLRRPVRFHELHRCLRRRRGRDAC